MAWECIPLKYAMARTLPPKQFLKSFESRGKYQSFDYLALKVSMSCTLGENLAEALIWPPGRCRSLSCHVARNKMETTSQNFADDVDIFKLFAHGLLSLPMWPKAPETEEDFTRLTRSTCDCGHPMKPDRSTHDDYVRELEAHLQAHAGMAGMWRLSWFMCWPFTWHQISTEFCCFCSFPENIWLSKIQLICGLSFFEVTHIQWKLLDAHPNCMVIILGQLMVPWTFVSGSAPRSQEAVARSEVATSSWLLCRTSAIFVKCDKVPSK